jgi:nanoRNase/pAp phosphatase (c-di-AMP/oligoRNAs hydrolase)
MAYQLNFNSVQQALTTAQPVLVIVPKRPSLDKVAAALALFLSLKKAGKEASIVCPDKMTVEFSSLIGLDKITQQSSGKNLIISFDFVEDSIEKVSYNIENNKFNLVIQPKIGFPPLSAEKVKYSYSGEVDLVFIVGAQSLEDLGSLSNQENNYSRKSLVNIDIEAKNTQFGKINLLDPTASSCSEIITSLISNLKLPINRDIASNLLLGIEKTTQGFMSSKTSLSTFEAVVFCLRSGGQRVRKVSWGKQTKKTSLESPPSIKSSDFLTKKPLSRSLKAKPEPSPDWLEPKIFKGGSRI